MSKLDYSKAKALGIDENIQIWNNAAFDDDESGSGNSWVELDVLAFRASNENRSPNILEAPSFNDNIRRTPIEERKDCEAILNNEIELVEKEITRLSERLEVLRLEKRRQSSGNLLDYGYRRSSMPGRRGLSLGPADIAASLPVKTAKGDRQLERIKEERRRPEKYSDLKNSRSVSPKYSTAPKIYDQRKGDTTTALKTKMRKREEMMVRPKKLFRDTSAPPGKQVKNMRTVASRYAKINSPEQRQSKDEEKNRQLGRRRWHIPDSTCALPNIRTVRRSKDSPRDSGCAKRVADLVGKKTYFTPDDVDLASSACQVLGFDV